MNKTSKLLLFLGLGMALCAQASLFAGSGYAPEKSQPEGTARQKIVKRLKDKGHASAMELDETQRVLDSLSDADVALVSDMYDMVDARSSFSRTNAEKRNQLKNVMRQVYSKNKDLFRSTMERLHNRMKERISTENKLPSADECIQMFNEALVK